MTQQPDPFSELRGLMAEATPLPWVGPAQYPSEVEDGDGLTIASCWHEHAVGASITIQGVLPCSLAESASNAALIVAAVNALPALLDERDRLIGENERLRLIATDAALLGQVVASSYTPDHKPHTLKNPKTGEVVTGPIADAVIELVKIIIEQGNTARQALSQEIG